MAKKSYIATGFKALGGNIVASLVMFAIYMLLGFLFLLFGVNDMLATTVGLIIFIIIAFIVQVFVLGLVYNRLWGWK